MFSIRFTSGAADTRDDEPTRRGEIVLGTFRESFLAPLVHWSEKHYLRQWKEASRRVLDGHERSALLVSVYDPRTATFLVWWPMYRVCEEKVLVANSLLFLDQLDSPLSVENPYVHVPDFSAVSEEGEPVSHWYVTLQEVDDYWESISHNNE